MSAVPGTIVVGLDGSPSSRKALDWAMEEAELRSLPLHLVHANAKPAQAAAGAGYESSDEILSAAVTRVQELSPEVKVTTEAVAESAAQALSERSAQASLVVTGARGRSGWQAAVLGSVSLKVATHAECPVVVVRDTEIPAAAGGFIVVAVDGSPASVPAVEFAFAEADLRGAEVRLVHAWWLEYGVGATRIVGYEEFRDQTLEEQRLVLAETLAGWQEKYPDVPVKQVLVQAHPVEAVVDFSQGASLVVVGSRGRGGFGSLMLGSVSQGVLQHATCPVAVVRR